MHFGFAGLLILTVFVNSLVAKDYIRGCYFTNWSQYHTGIWKFMPKNIETGLCSHIFYAFAGMGDDFKIKATEPDDLDSPDILSPPGLYRQINDIKLRQRDLKTLLSFGGFLFSTQNVPLMQKLLKNVDNRKIFIDSAIAFVRLHKFDGFDFNWFPLADSKDDFVKLVQEFRKAIDIESQTGRQPKLLLTAGVPSHVDQIEAGYDGKVLADSLDWMNIMAFDYHGPWENKTGFNTPLYDRNHDGLSVNSTISYLMDKQHVSKDKLVVGLASYGHGWKIRIRSEPDSIPSPVIGPSPPQPFTLTAGTAAYFEICTLIEKNSYTERFDDIQKSPYIFKDGVWFGYANQRSFKEELNWLIQKDLAGAFVWSLDMDDFLGQCRSSGGTYPLVKTVRTMLVKK